MSDAQDTPAKVSPLAGKPATPAMLVDLPRLVTAYYTGVPDFSVREQRVAFGTSGHRGSAFERTFNAFLESGPGAVKKIPYEQVARAATTHRHDYLSAYVSDLGSVIDLHAIRGANIRMGVDSLGGAGVHYWGRIAERYGLNLTVVNEVIDPTFRFMTVDWDGRIRMDPSSPYAMQSLIGPSRIASTSLSPATPTMIGMASSPGRRGCCRPTIIYRSPFSTSFNIEQSGARMRPLARRSSAAK